MRLSFFLTIFFCCSFYHALGQNENNLTYGLKFGGLYSNINNLPESIKGRDNTLKDDDFKSNGKYGVEAGFFLNYKLPDSRTALQPEILYRTSGEQIIYNDVNGNNFKLGFEYSYLQIGASYKIYPYEGFNFGIGAFYSINLSPNNISYNSNEADGLYDVTTRQFYKEGLKGTDDLAISISIGYELRKSIHFDLRYYLGVKDAIKSNPSSFQFIENQNKTSVFSLSIGYSFHQW